MDINESLKKGVYSLLDLATLGRGIKRTIGGYDIRFPARFSRYYPADYEPVLFNFLKNNLSKGDVFFDCGAHLGLFSVVASRLVAESGVVYAFEPMPGIRNICDTVLKLNHCKNVVLRPEAVSSKVGTAEFFDTGNEASNANSLVQQSRHSRSIKVPVTTIDEFRREINKRINCIKIDVEGAEFDLICGAENTLKQEHPLLFLSMHPPALSNAGVKPAEIWDKLTNLGYVLKKSDSAVSKDWFVSQDVLFDVECMAQK